MVWLNMGLVKHRKICETENLHWSLTSSCYISILKMTAVNDFLFFLINPVNCFESRIKIFFLALWSSFTGKYKWISWIQSILHTIANVWFIYNPIGREEYNIGHVVLLALIFYSFTRKTKTIEIYQLKIIVIYD